MVVIDCLALLYVSVGLPFLPRPCLLTGWREVAERVEHARDALLPETGTAPFIIADGIYQLASELAFYMHHAGRPDWGDVVPFAQGYGEGLSYAYWNTPDQFMDRDALFITADLMPAKLDGLRAVFTAVDEPRALVSVACGLGLRRYWVVRCRGFRGLPPKQNGP